MSYSEYIGWLEYLSKPNETEIQLARISNLLAISVGAENTKVTDFLVNYIEEDYKSSNFEDITEEEINKLAGL